MTQADIASFEKDEVIAHLGSPEFYRDEIAYDAVLGHQVGDATTVVLADKNRNWYSPDVVTSDVSVVVNLDPAHAGSLELDFVGDEVPPTPVVSTFIDRSLGALSLHGDIPKEGNVTIEAPRRPRTERMLAALGFKATDGDDSRMVRSIAIG